MTTVLCKVKAMLYTTRDRHYLLFVPDNLWLSKSLLRNYHTFFPQKMKWSSRLPAPQPWHAEHRCDGQGAGRPPVSWTLIAEPCRFSPLHVLLLFVINAEMRGRDDTRRKSAVDVACMEMPCQCHFSSYRQRERERDKVTTWLGN